MKLIAHWGDVDSQLEMLKPGRNYSLSAQWWQWQHNLSTEESGPCFQCLMARLLSVLLWAACHRPSRSSALTAEPSMQSVFVSANNPIHIIRLLCGSLSNRYQTNRESEKIKTGFFFWVFQCSSAQTWTGTPFINISSKENWCHFYSQCTTCQE